jgi:hypothetical protein
MSCPLCDENHGLLDCIHYVSTPQPLKDFLGRVFTEYPTIAPKGRKPSEVIYDRFYAQASPAVWEASVGSTLKPITQRIYLAVQQDSLLKVWDFVKSLENRVQGFSFAKRCRPVDARTRLDTIVIYAADLASRNNIVEMLRNALRDSHWQQPQLRGPQTRPARIVREDFKQQILPGTGGVADLQGVSVAFDPGPGVSFGDNLCNATAEIYEDAKKRGYLQSQRLFVGFALAALSRKYGFNIRAPWKLQP